MAKMVHDRDDMRYIQYRCKCGAEDTDKIFEHEHIKPALNCWKCHAGVGKQISFSEMADIKLGMQRVFVQ